MQFANPAFLYALSLVAIPIAIHLFGFRRYQKVYFSNVRWLQVLQQENKSSSRLKRLLVLISRILAIVALVVAFARPYIPLGDKLPPSADLMVSVFVDNSYSMNQVNEKGSLLEEAKQKALELSDLLPINTRYQLLTHDFLPESNQTLDKDGFRKAISAVASSSASRSINEIFLRQQNFLAHANDKRKLAYIISDFQSPMMDRPTITDSLIRLNLVKINSLSSDNISLDSVVVTSPILQEGLMATLKVYVTNHGGKPAEALPLSVLINGKQKVARQIDIPAGKSFSTEVSFIPSGRENQLVVCRITDHPVTFDNEYRIVLPISDRIKVIHLTGSEGNRFPEMLFQNDSTVLFGRYSSEQFSYSLIDQSNLIIVDGEAPVSSTLEAALTRFLKGGGSLFMSIGSSTKSSVLLKSFGVNLSQTADTTAIRVGVVEKNAPFFAGTFEEIPENADLPVIKNHYKISGALPDGFMPLIKLIGGDPLFVEVPVGEGMLYLYLAPLDYTGGSMVKNTLFVPLLYNAALLSMPLQKGNFRTSEAISVDIKSTGEYRQENYFKVIPPQGGDGMIPVVTPNERGINLLLPEGIDEVGFAKVMAGGDELTQIAINHNSVESSATTMGEKELIAWIEQHGIKSSKVILDEDKSLKTNIEEQVQGRQLWKTFLKLALIFLGIEVILLRFMPLSSGKKKSQNINSHDSSKS